MSATIAREITIFFALPGVQYTAACSQAQWVWVCRVYNVPRNTVSVISRTAFPGKMHIHTNNTGAVSLTFSVNSNMEQNTETNWT